MEHSYYYAQENYQAFVKYEEISTDTWKYEYSFRKFITLMYVCHTTKMNFHLHTVSASKCSPLMPTKFKLQHLNFLGKNTGQEPAFTTFKRSKL